MRFILLPFFGSCFWFCFGGHTWGCIETLDSVFSGLFWQRFKGFYEVPRTEPHIEKAPYYCTIAPVPIKDFSLLVN